MVSKEKKIAHRMMLLIELYLLGTVVLFFVGPLKWEITNPIKLLLYLVVILIALPLGYILFYESKIEIPVDEEKDDARELSSNRYWVSEELLIFGIKWMLILDLVVLSLYLLRNLGSNELSIENIFMWIKDPSAQYFAGFSQEPNGEGRIVAALATASSFFLWGTIPLGLIYFNRLEIKYRVLVVLCVLIELLRWIAAGTNKGTIDLILIFCCLVYVQITKREKKMISQKMKYVIVAIALVVLGIIYFSNNIGGRVEGNYQYLLNSIKGAATLDMNVWLLKVFPGLESIIIYMDDYLTQGYFGLALGLEEKFVPMFGVGNSVFLLENVQQMLGVDLTRYTYMNRINNDVWSATVNWHTAYLWFANDVGPLGAIVVVMLLGCYFGFVSYNLFVKKNKLFFPLFCMCVQMFFYFPMNNQIFSSPFSFMGFVGMNLNLFLIRYGVIGKSKVMIKAV